MAYPLGRGPNAPVNKILVLIRLSLNIYLRNYCKFRNFRENFIFVNGV